MPWSWPLLGIIFDWWRERCEGKKKFNHRATEAQSSEDAFCHNRWWGERPREPSSSRKLLLAIAINHQTGFLPEVSKGGGGSDSGGAVKSLGYEAASRLQGVANGVYSVFYSYALNKV